MVTGKVKMRSYPVVLVNGYALNQVTVFFIITLHCYKAHLEGGSV